MTENACKTLDIRNLKHALLILGSVGPKVIRKELSPERQALDIIKDSSFMFFIESFYFL